MVDIVEAAKLKSNGINEIMAEILNNMSYYSAVVIAFSVVLLSFAISNPMKGVIYIGWVLSATILRIIFMMMVSTGNKNIPENCKKGSLIGPLTEYDAGRNSIYILTFTLMYICFPMIISKNINWYILWLLVVYLIFDCIIKYRTTCIVDPLVYVGEIIGGSVGGLSVSSMMYYLGLNRFLFINDVGSGRQVCSVAKNQTFKCAVYKNGEIISTIMR
jgi:hypothetical protein